MFKPITVNDVELMVKYANKYLELLVADDTTDPKELVEIASKIEKVEAKVKMLLDRFKKGNK